jgi:ribonuclease HII
VAEAHSLGVAQSKYIVGIDEVGRGPLAGPVSIGIAVIPKAYDISRYFTKLTDSKQMTEKAREAACVEAEVLQKNGTISYGVFSSSAEQIDEWGIEAALSVAIVKGLQKLAPNPEECEVFLDGRLKAPKEYRQEAIIKGDLLVPVISLASVVAKVSRDRYMAGIVHQEFPEYGFDSHKGYGTASHIRAIREHGPSSVHRRSFLSNILLKPQGAGTMPS